MTLVEFATNRSAQLPLAHGIRAVVRWISTYRAARAKRAVLQNLLFEPDYRLRDLGISRDELIRAAIEGRRK